MKFLLITLIAVLIFLIIAWAGSWLLTNWLICGNPFSKKQSVDTLENFIEDIFNQLNDKNNEWDE